MEFQLGLSEKRKNLDGFKIHETRNSCNMENAVDILGEREYESSASKCDLRKSLAWDSAFFTSPGVLDPDELLQTLNFWEMENKDSIIGRREQVYLPSESMEQERTSRIGNCNLRRSLAWDNAFFTNAGVLDPYELSMINKGFVKSGIRGFPCIEELQQSVESSTTIDSDSFSLESLEYDLFGGIRASTEKSSTNSSVASLNCRLGRKTASKKSDQSCQSRIKLKPTSGRQSTNGNRVQKTTKDSHVHPRHVARSGESSISLSLKPPKILGQCNPVLAPPAERDALGAKHNKIESKAAKVTKGQYLTESKRPCLGHSLIFPTSAPCSKPSLGSPNTNDNIVMSLTDGPSDYACITPSNSLSRKFDSRCTTRKRPALGEKSEPTYLLPTPKAYSGKSPATSVDRRPLKSSVHCDAATPMGSKPISPNALLNLKPSGLRLPSPKIGFFDENSIVESLNGDLVIHGGAEGSLSELRTPNSDIMKSAAKGATNSKNRSAESMTGIGIHVSQQAGYPSSASSIEEQSASPQVSVSSGTMKKRLIATFRSHKDLSEKLSGKDNLKLERMGARRLNGPESGRGSCLKAKGKRSHVAPESNLRAEKKSPKELKQVSQLFTDYNLHVSEINHDKENVLRFEDQVRSLIDQMGVIDLRRDVVEQNASLATV